MTEKVCKLKEYYESPGFQRKRLQFHDPNFCLRKKIKDTKETDEEERIIKEVRERQ